MATLNLVLLGSVDETWLPSPGVVFVVRRVGCTDDVRCFELFTCCTGSNQPTDVFLDHRCLNILLPWKVLCGTCFLPLLPPANFPFYSSPSSVVCCRELSVHWIRGYLARCQVQDLATHLRMSYPIKDPAGRPLFIATDCL